MFPDNTTSITMKQLQFLSVELDFFLFMKQDQYFCGSIEANALCCVCLLASTLQSHCILWSHWRLVTETNLLIKALLHALD